MRPYSREGGMVAPASLPPTAGLLCSGLPIEPQPSQTLPAPTQTCTP
jgi:hypothetical protein